MLATHTSRGKRLLLAAGLGLCSAAAARRELAMMPAPKHNDAFLSHPRLVTFSLLPAIVILPH